ncbi:1023_t:CDS:2 [Cetraspora pellucida]|uniref:1023_t:CDS:1 n=1 Tax=Cetraspora pellucida TaxID=1433469 RepID=A0ACA9MBA4_9GLOM|nr:1023_t:CDS:2 [Cetraspora pellucida]
MSQNRRKSRRKRDHPVWEYFSSRNSDSDRIYCKECKDPLFSYKSNTSVSNPKRHFMLYHKEIWSQIENECSKTSDKKPQNISMNDMETSSASTSYAGPSNFPANMESPSMSENDVESLDVSTAEKEIKRYTLKNLKKVGISGFVPKTANEVYLETEDNNLEIEKRNSNTGVANDRIMAFNGYSSIRRIASYQTFTKEIMNNTISIPNQGSGKFIHKFA